MPVSLVIPGRNCAATLAACLDAVTPLLVHGELAEIVFVDDVSTDDTAAIAARYPVRVIRGPGLGIGAARNVGWQAAQQELIWFLDSDCVAEPDALATLLAELNEEKVTAVGGSYANMRPDSFVACVIHEEIVARHARMPRSVQFVGTFNALYRRSALVAVGGFGEARYKYAAEDADLSFRLRANRFELRFAAASRVGHYHLTNFWRYLQVQRRHGFYRLRLCCDHPQRIQGDSYNTLCDAIQPPLALLGLLLLPLLWWPLGCAVVLAILFLLLLAQLPMTWRIVQRTRQVRYLAYIPFGMLRAFSRSIGVAQGVVSLVGNRLREWTLRSSRSVASSEHSFAARGSK